MTEVITASAAGAAAVFSLLNVFLSNRLARSGQVQQWRRDNAREIMISYVETVEKVDLLLFEIGRGISGHKWIKREVPPEELPRLMEMVATQAVEEELRKTEKVVVGIMEAAHRQLTELELSASQKCARAGRDIYQLMGPLLDRMLREWPSSLDRCELDPLYKARNDFISVCRADLGVGRRFR